MENIVQNKQLEIDLQSQINKENAINNTNNAVNNHHKRNSSCQPKLDFKDKKTSITKHFQGQNKEVGKQIENDIEIQIYDKQLPEKQEINDIQKDLEQFKKMTCYQRIKYVSSFIIGSLVTILVQYGIQASQ